MQLTEFIQQLQQQAAELPSDTEVFIAADIGDRIEHVTPTQVMLATTGLVGGTPHGMHLTIFAKKPPVRSRHET
jgi:hypothetical protein